ncbi:MAG: type II toxin-antitoxin system Phd/YefM family antitoxin [bacterium]
MQNLDVKNIRPITDFRNNMKKYLKELNSNKRPILLTQNGKSAAVLLHAETFQDMQDQFEFMRNVAEGLEDYNKGRIHSVEETFHSLDRIIHDAEN